jgi:hypothetical protein
LLSNRERTGSLFRVVENDAERAPMARIKLADAVPQFHTVKAACAFHRAVVNREDHNIAFGKRNDFGARLHAGTLLVEHQFAASEVLARLGK